MARSTPEIESRDSSLTLCVLPIEYGDENVKGMDVY